MEYFDRANWTGKSERLPISKGQARSRHSAREPYGVRFQSGDGFIEVEFYFGPAYCGVSFLTDLDTPTLSYFFEEVGDRLFLFQALYWSGGKGASETSEYYFERVGQVTITRSNAAGDRETGENTIDVSQNWEPKPLFGEMAGLAKRERAV